MRVSGRWWLAMTALAGFFAGCERAVEVRDAVQPEVADLDPALQKLLHQQLEKWCGTPGNRKLLGGESLDAEHLKRGAEVYARYCAACHGTTGDGNGIAASYMNPVPRDYRRGIFKFTSTGYGTKPRRSDLLNTVRRGVTGTSMPSFTRLSKRDLEAVVDYVLALTHRGELEILLLAQAQNEEAIEDQAVDELVGGLLDQWKAANEEVIEPVTRMLDFSPDSVAAGQAVFQKRECVKCHGRDGRGGMAGGIEVGTDVWGHKTAAADLTSGMLHGGGKPLDLYRRIYAGINGTPMPAFKDILSSEPDTIWQLVHYVLNMSDQRRHGVQFPPEGPGAAAGVAASPSEAAPSSPAGPAAESPAAEPSEPTP